MQRLLRVMLVMAIFLSTGMLSMIPSSTALAASGITESLPYISQFINGGSQAECGPTAVAMALSAYGLKPADKTDGQFIIDVRNATKPLDEHPYTTPPELAPALDYYKIPYQKLSGSLSERIQMMKDATARQQPVVVLVQSEKLGFGRNYGGHWVVLRGFSSDGTTVYVNDPDATSLGGGENKAWSYSAFVSALDYYDGTWRTADGEGFIVGPGLGGVMLFDQPSFQGTLHRLTSSGNQNLPASIDNTTTSILISRGWSVRVYQRSNGDTQGGWKNFTTSDGDLADNTYEGLISSSIINNTISSVYVAYGVCLPSTSSIGYAAASSSSTCDPNPTPGPSPTPNPGSGSITVQSVSPSGANFQGGQTFFPSVTVQTSGFSLDCGRDFLQNVDNNLYDTHLLQGCQSMGGNTYRFAFGDDMVAPEQPGTYHSRWKVHYNGGVSGPEIDIWFVVPPRNQPPQTPRPLSPANGQIVYGHQLPQLCATTVSDPEGDAVQYLFDIYNSAHIGNGASTFSSSCWQPKFDPANIHHTYTWRVAAKDIHGNQSSWSEGIKFTLAPPLVANPRPISAPPTLPTMPVVEGAIWPGWANYRILPIVASQDLPVGTLIKVDGLDLSPLVAAGKIRPDYRDVRVVRRLDATHWQEVARTVYTPWDIEFFLAAPMRAGVSNDYYLVYGNPNAGPPPTYTMPQGFFLDLYLDKGGNSWNQTITFNTSVDFNEVCAPPIDHRERTGGSCFDDSEGVRGRIFVPSTGKWTFKVYMPDGYWMYLDRQEIGRFEGYNMNNTWLTVGTRDLKAGWYDLDLHDIWVNSGALKLAMSGPGFPEQIVPAHYFQQFWANTQHVTPDVEQFFDQIPPTTTLIATPGAPNGLQGWYTTAVQVALTATDNPNGSGVKETWYAINSGARVRYAGPIDLRNDGIYVVTFYSIDNAGNVEQAKTETIRIDQTAPSAAIELAGTLSGSGWYTTTLQISIAGSDASPGSGVAYLEWRADGGLWQRYAGTFTYATEGVSTLEVRAVDVAGNVQPSPTTHTIRLDTRAPLVSASLGQAEYTRAQTATVTAVASDPTPGSGLQHVTRTLNGEAVTDGQVLDLLFRSLGTYTLTVEATDQAGWRTTAVASFDLIATADGLLDTIPLLEARGEITHAGITTALTKKIEAALAAIERGNVTAAINDLEALRQQITAQAGKKITQRAADLLLGDIDAIVAQLRAGS